MTSIAGLSFRSRQLQLRSGDRQKTHRFHRSRSVGGGDPSVLVRPIWANLRCPCACKACRRVCVAPARHPAPPDPPQALATTASPAPAPPGGRATVEAFYKAYNNGDIPAISNLIADDILYADLTYANAKHGKAAVLAWLRKVREFAPDDLVFVIEDITDGDPSRVGLKWHVELGEGVHFPFSRGCSFITLDNDGRILSVRDVVESSSKPGDQVLWLLGALAPLIRATLRPGVTQLPIEAGKLWALFAGYVGVMLLSDLPPGPPATATPPEVLTEVFRESVNIFWINEALSHAGLSPIPVVPCPPVSEALFNFVLAYCALLLPLLWTDARAQRVGNKGAWAVGIAFLTNVFFIPFMALRAAPLPSDAAAAPSPAPGAQRIPAWGRAVGAAGLAAGFLSVAWAFAGRPEMGGDLATRWQFFVERASTDRVFFAFLVDMPLFYAWQVAFLAAAPAPQRWVPFVGLGAYLLAGGGDGPIPAAEETPAAEVQQQQQ